MNKENKIENGIKLFTELYNLSINEKSVQDELIGELKDCELESVIDVDLNSWFSELERIDNLNEEVVRIGKEKPQLYNICKHLNVDLVVIMYRMKNFMEKEFNVVVEIESEASFYDSI